MGLSFEFRIDTMELPVCCVFVFGLGSLLTDIGNKSFCFQDVVYKSLWIEARSSRFVCKQSTYSKHHSRVLEVMAQHLAVDRRATVFIDGAVE